MRIDRSKYTLNDALGEIALAETILDGMGAKAGLTLFGRIADIKEKFKKEKEKYKHENR